MNNMIPLIQAKEIVEILIKAEQLKDLQAKDKNPELTGESSSLFYLKRLRELINTINDEIKNK